MSEISTEVLTTLQTVVPGFVATAFFYWLSDVPKPSQFERVVQALIGTGLIKLMIDGVEAFALWAGKFYVVGSWTPNTAILWSFGIASVGGILLAYCAKHDILFDVARRFGLTSKASVSEWQYSFTKFDDRGLVLNLKDGRRLMGYPVAWPSDPMTGHFLMQFPRWAGSRDPVICEGVSFMMIPSSDVLWVEFLEPNGGS